MHHCCQDNNEMMISSWVRSHWILGNVSFPVGPWHLLTREVPAPWKHWGIKVRSDLPGSLNTQKIQHKILHKGQCENVSCYLYNLHFPILANCKKQNMAGHTIYPIKKTYSNYCSATKLPHRFKCSNCFSVRSSRPCLAEFIKAVPLLWWEPKSLKF